MELRKGRNGIEVAHLGLEPLAPDIVVDSMIVDSGTVSSAISKLFTDNAIKAKAVATAVSGHSVIVKKISLPSMSDQELAETIEKEAAQHIPFDLADVNLDYQILSEDAGSPQMDVLLVAVKKDKILNYTNVLSMAGKTPAIVDIDALALQNCYEYNYEPAPGQVVALLNLGASVMNINIVKGTTPLFPRDVSVGGYPCLCVGSVHPANASPKNTKGAFWIPQSAAQVFSIADETFAGKAIPWGTTTPPANFPLVSCVMPTFNRRSFIPLALTCFRSQTYPNKELVVVDDGSDSVGDLLSGLRDVHYVRVPRRMTIGAKRNLGCREGRGEIIAQWDDDDWYAPNRLARQIAPIVAGDAEMTGLANRFMLELPSGKFWTLADELHRRMFVGDVHGGTLVYRKSLLAEGIKYPDINLAEDASLIQQAKRRRKRILRVENAEQFVYLRHSRNAWKFEVGQFMNPQGWSPTTAPFGFTNDVLDLYRTAAQSLASPRLPVAT